MKIGRRLSHKPSAKATFQVQPHRQL
jgi:hypothetical protein